MLKNKKAEEALWGPDILNPFVPPRPYKLTCPLEDKVKSAPEDVVSNFFTLLWYNSTAPFWINFAISSESPALLTLNSVALTWTLSSLSIWIIPVVLLINEFVPLWKIVRSEAFPNWALTLSLDL